TASKRQKVRREQAVCHPRGGVQLGLSAGGPWLPELLPGPLFGLGACGGPLSDLVGGFFGPVSDAGGFFESAPGFASSRPLSDAGLTDSVAVSTGECSGLGDSSCPPTGPSSTPRVPTDPAVRAGASLRAENGQNPARAMSPAAAAIALAVAARGLRRAAGASAPGEGTDCWTAVVRCVGTEGAGVIGVTTAVAVRGAACGSRSGGTSLRTAAILATS